ncbi:Zinc (Zn2)-Iron (Fe2) Permease (ZIP) Family [Thraustotheca clavata]|uniref:Zinc (Zn2)-Iron (Fe2) Permease (ZIP) Family n=1 Tax=Thraustotheca clavata TaxID=74557 RepID=A0A1V9ZS06_9STRA|nr:Zinc (Zn2)-Iron (Fe2) Permease (ZIP) Family [Thraustotheca clavata]
MRSLVFIVAIVGAQTTPKPTFDGLLYEKWQPFTSPIVIPKVIDMRTGGSLQMNIGQTNEHSWGNGVPLASMYGYGAVGQNITHPGPTILAKKGVNFTVEWFNTLGTNTHLLGRYIEPTLLRSNSECFPNCGIPVVTHIHGLETPPKYDGLPHYSIYKNQSYRAIYNNTQSSSTKIYHDHAIGLARLNMWAGLVGMYIIEDPEVDSKYNLTNLTDIPLILSDKIIDPEGKLLYTSVVTCPIGGSLWMSESWGTVNTVNGVVMPYMEVPATQVRFRLANLANSRHYKLEMPYSSKCMLIATDSGYVGKTTPANSSTLIYPLERMEFVCDFTGVANGTVYNVTDGVDDIDSSYTYDNRVLQLRIVTPSVQPTPVTIPSQLTQFKDLQGLYNSTKGKLRTITLGEMNDMNQCPTQSTLTQYGQVANVSTITNKLMCTRGKVEKWQFRNPTDDPHPFHWHLVNVQCGPDDDHINKNELKDVFVIPNNPQQLTVNLICYVACTPDEFLVENSTRAPTDYGFSTDEPYLAHCHIMEHEDNSMMAWFQLLAEDDSNPIDDGHVASTSDKLTNTVIWTAIGMSIIGGFATTLSVLVISIPSLNFLAGDKALAMTFSVSAGVMLFISFVDLFTESITSYRNAWAVGGSGVDPELVEQGLAPPGTVAAVCDPTCVGYAWLATTACFYGGMLVIMAVELIVHRVFDYHAKDLTTLGDHNHGENEVLECEMVEAKTPVDKDGIANLTSDESSGNTEAQKQEFRRAGVLTGIAIAIHNFPEGIALFVASLQGLKTGVVLAIGIVLHNFPEGVAIAAPVYYATNSKKQAFFWTALSGIAQPCGAFIGWATVSGGVTPLLSATLYGLVSGMLVCITVKELIPGAFKFGGANFTYSFFAGVGIMALSLILLKFVGSS